MESLSSIVFFSAFFSASLFLFSSLRCGPPCSIRFGSSGTESTQIESILCKLPSSVFRSSTWRVLEVSIFYCLFCLAVRHPVCLLSRYSNEYSSRNYFMILLSEEAQDKQTIVIKTDCAAALSPCVSSVAVLVCVRSTQRRVDMCSHPKILSIDRESCRELQQSINRFPERQTDSMQLEFHVLDVFFVFI